VIGVFGQKKQAVINFAKFHLGYQEIGFTENVIPTLGGSEKVRRLWLRSILILFYFFGLTLLSLGTGEMF